MGGAIDMGTLRLVINPFSTSARELVVVVTQVDPGDQLAAFAEDNNTRT